MTIYIPAWVVLVVAITVVWLVLGYAFNNLVLVRISHRWMRQHQTGTVPKWSERWAYFIAGPVGWAAALYDVIHYRKHPLMRNYRKRK